MNDKITKLLVLLLMVGLSIYIAVSMPEEKTSNALMSLSQLNIAVAVGIGAISIGVLKKDESKNIISELTIATAMLGVLTFLISFLEHSLLNKGYLVLNIFILTVILIGTSSEIKNKNSNPTLESD